MPQSGLLAGDVLDAHRAPPTVGAVSLIIATDARGIAGFAGLCWAWSSTSASAADLGGRNG